MPPNAPMRRANGAPQGLRRLQPDLAQIDADAETGFDGLRPATGENLHRVAAGILVETIEFEIAVIVRSRHRDRRAVFQELHACALDAIDHAVLSLGHRAADEALRVAPEIAVIDARLRAKFRLHHFEILLPRHARHFLVLDLDGAHRAGRAGLLAARLLPALVDEMCVERPGLRQLQVFVPPDVAIGAGVDQLFLPFGLDRIDDDDAVGTLLDGA